MTEFTPFAKFENSGELKYRTETYLILTKEKEELKNKEFLKILKDKKCIGVVVMLNPGSSCSKEVKYGEIVEAEPDDTMERIEKCILIGYKNNLPSGVYIQISNLFNLCCTKSKDAIKIYNKYKDNPLMTTRIKYKNEIQWILMAWSCILSLYKERKDIFDIVNQEPFSKKIIKKDCKGNNKKDNLRFWHPLQCSTQKQNELITSISTQMSDKVIQPN